MERLQQFRRRLRRGKGKVPGIKPLTYRVFKKKAIVLRKQTIPLATALGRVITTLLANPMGISITALLMTAEETNKVWGIRPTGESDGAPR